jgi:hypothetical protein
VVLEAGAEHVRVCEPEIAGLVHGVVSCGNSVGDKDTAGTEYCTWNVSGAPVILFTIATAFEVPWKPVNVETVMLAATLFTMTHGAGLTLKI